MYGQLPFSETGYQQTFRAHPIACFDNPKRILCQPITAKCICPPRLAFTIRWSDVELNFGYFRSQLSKTFRDIVELFVNMFDYALKIRGQFIRQNVEYYSNNISDYGATLNRCVRFIDCIQYTRIKMQGPVGSGTHQRCLYSGQKRFDCLKYQIITNADGLLCMVQGKEGVMI